jgi:Rho-related BTB domain-containing protein 1/2
MPEKARAVARDLGIPYYETSSLTYYGIDQVFENAIRAALCARRNQRFWMTGLKKVMQPGLQVSQRNIQYFGCVILLCLFV